MPTFILEQGVNVTRTDVIFELANRVGLKMNAFAAAFGSACADPVAGVAVRLRDLVVRPAGVPGYVAEWCDR